VLLAIDCGNTNTVFSVWTGERFLATWRIATDHTRTADEYFVWLSALMRLTQTEVSVTEAVISSTVPRVVFNLRVLCDRYFGTRPLVVGRPDCRLPVPPRVDQGTIVGPDRLTNTVAVVDTDGAYIGGVIAPGVNLSLEALHMAAAALPHIDITKPAQVIGTNTVACMQSGVYWGYIGLVEGIVGQIRHERDRPMKVIATGGLATLFDQGFDLFDSVEDDLTMHGLVLINRYNKETDTA
jgi:type III pantothenate kinase